MSSLTPMSESIVTGQSPSIGKVGIDQLEQHDAHLVAYREHLAGLVRENDRVLAEKGITAPTPEREPEHVREPA
ncbi:MAG: hypothetical protein WAX89_06600 [Alphaproteobacteria bacterium]